LFKKVFDINICLFQNCPQSAFGHLSGVIRDCGKSFCFGIKSDFVTAGGLTVKLKAETFQNPDNFAVSKT
jgi:hypothetical protein